MLQKQILVSTTNEIAGWTIISHLDIVSAHIVAGTNIFKDIAATFSDVFGGRTKSYQNEIEKIDKGVHYRYTRLFFSLDSIRHRGFNDCSK